MSEATEVDLLANVRTGDWLDAQTFPPMRWAVQGVLPEGFGLITGPPKAGKSWAVFGIALAVAAGGLALGKIPTGQGRPVLVLALEDGDRRLQGRARHLLGEGVPIPARLNYITKVTPGAVIATIDAWLAIYGDQAPLVVLDTLGKVMPPRMAGEDTYQRDYRIGSHLKALADKYPGTCLAVVHHTRKMTAEDWMDSTSGTNGLNGAADWTVNISRARNESAGVLRVTGRDVPEGEYAITSDSGQWTLDGDTLVEAASQAQAARVAEGLGERSAEVVAFVASRPEGVRAAEVAESLGMTAKDAGTYLMRAYEAGRIGKPSRGLYTPVGSVGSVGNEESLPTLSTLPTPLCRACGEPLAYDDGTGIHATCQEVA